MWLCQYTGCFFPCNQFIHRLLRHPFGICPVFFSLLVPPYIIHPLCVAIILAELELDKETIAAGLLHDVLEDTIMTMDEMRAEFGDDVAHLVDGVTKLKLWQSGFYTRADRVYQLLQKRLSLLRHKAQQYSRGPLPPEYGADYGMLRERL